MSTQKNTLWKFIFLFLMFYLMVFGEVFRKVSGKVIDEETGAVIKDVEVILSFKNFRKVTKTNERGEFNFEQAPSGNGLIAFYPPAPYACELYKDEWNELRAENNRNLNIIKKIKRAGILEITATDPGKNIAIKKAHIFLGESNSRFQLRKEYIYTNELGKIYLDQIYPFVYSIWARADGYGLKLLRKCVEVQSNKNTSFNVLFDSRNPTRIRGSLRCTTGNLSLTHIFVGMSRKDSYGWTNTYTDENGNYCLYDLEPGDYEIFVIRVDLKKEEEEDQEFNIIKKVTVYKGQTSIVNFDLDCSFEYKTRARE